jgi:aromatic-L-amino-acid/L-tryptophan decarboxylase
MTPEEFRQHGHALIDWIAGYRTRLARSEFAVLSQCEPGALLAQLPAEAPMEPEPFAAIADDLDRLILPACAHFQSPDFFGYFPSNGLLASVLGDLAATGLGQLGLNWQSSPALTELETRMCDWLRQMSGLDSAWQGVVQDTASTATLVALICARERATQYAAARGGLQSCAKELVLYASVQAHSSVEKAALLAGFGREQLRLIPVDEKFALRADALATAIAADRAAGRQPCALIATVGTTATTAIDPVAACALLARQQGLWLHVDAALGGSAMILPECRPLWAGIDGADSLVVNPHKWLGAAFDCSVYFVRDPEHLVRVMSTNPSYLQTAADGKVPNYRDWGIPLGRRMRALKLWFLIREQGVSGLQARLRRDLANARWLAAQVDSPAAQAAGWRRLAPVPLQTLVLRHEKPGDDADLHTQAWVRSINQSGDAYLTPALLERRWMVRVSIGSALTERAHVEKLWTRMRAAAER